MPPMMRALIKTRAGVCRWSVIVSEEASCQTLCFQELFCLLTVSPTTFAIPRLYFQLQVSVGKSGRSFFSTSTLETSVAPCQCTSLDSLNFPGNLPLSGLCCLCSFLGTLTSKTYLCKNRCSVLETCFLSRGR